ncbi:amidohydrolase [bacterium]|nr:amidohydrolase [bacterium]
MSATLAQAVDALNPELIAHRREFHRHPELGFHEVRTADRLVEILEGYGLTVERMVKTGVVACIKGDRPGKTLLLRADIDALPLQELSTHDYKSEHDGVMHACGHDAHMAILLGVAKILSERKHEFSGTVKLVFQPAEEGPGGAKPMIEAGVMENPKVDAAIGLHVWNNQPVGTVGTRPGPVMANTDEFSLEIVGKGGHGAMPHLSVDAITVAGQVIGALQTIVSRNVSPLDSAVVTLGSIRGGERHNIIAQTVHLSGTVRSFSPAVGSLLPRRIEEVVAGVTRAMGATYHLHYHRVYPATVNDPGMTELVRQAAIKVVGESHVIEAEPSMGGEDMAYFLQEVPGCYFFVGTANPEKGLDYPHHHPRFDIDEAGLTVGVKVMLQAVYDYLA